jgi:ABC-type lipoprotein release transport system permease subunit
LYSKEFFNVDKNHSTDLTVWLSPDTQINSASIVLEISNVVENIKILEKRSMGDIMHHSTNERAGIFILIWNVILIGTLLFAFTISSAVSVDSRREIGLLKSMGFTTMDVLEIRLLEFTMTGFIASTIGLFGAIIYDFYLGAPILADYMLGWSVLFPPFILPLRITIDIVIIAYSIGIIPLVIATVVPAWKNAIRDPDEVLRGL